MNTTVEKLEGNRVRLTVSHTAVEVDAAVAAAYLRVARQVKLPGFRPGKAPRPLIDTHVGRESVLAEALEDLVESSYPRALDELRLRPMSAPDTGDLDLLGRGRGLHVHRRGGRQARVHALVDRGPQGQGPAGAHDRRRDRRADRLPARPLRDPRGRRGPRHRRRRLRAALVHRHGRRQDGRRPHRGQVPLRGRPRHHAARVRDGDRRREARRPAPHRVRRPGDRGQPRLRRQARRVRGRGLRDQGEEASRDRRRAREQRRRVRDDRRAARGHPHEARREQGHRARPPDRARRSRARSPSASRARSPASWWRPAPTR